MGGVMVNPMGGEMMAGAVVPVDECAAGTNNCNANAQCVDTADGFECRCNSGYAGNGVVCADVTECDNANGGCAQNCTNNDGGFVCSCNAGFSLNADGRTCDDINECDNANGGCTQNCANNDGGGLPAMRASP